jgi:hypothetical protein
MEITHEDPMKVMPLEEWFDLSENPDDDTYYGSNYYSKKNKKVIGKFKDEMSEHRVYIKEVVALRSKMYSCLKHDGKNKATAKGVSGPVRDKLTHDKYIACLKHEDGYQLEKADMTSFRTDGVHTINTITISKSTLSPCDSKLYLLDAVNTYPYGHCRIRDLPPS